jgi:SAM-dependent methyltransferase
MSKSLTNTEVVRIVDNHHWKAPLRMESPCLYVSDKSAETSSTAYSDELMKMLDVGATSSWWYETRNQVIWNQICRYPINGALWDVGSGLGEVSSYLTSVGLECVADEPNRVGAQASSEKGVFSVQSDLHSLELPDSSIGAVGLFDVLEHLDDADNALSEIYRVLNGNGKLFITVPATKWLWSASDDLAGHHLRYTRKKIRQQLKNAGFEVLSIRYFFFSLVLPILILRVVPYRLGIRSLIDDTKLVQKKSGWVSRLITKVEVALCGKIPIGTSLMIVATRKSL